MLDRISDFYRIVHPAPSDTFISQRKESIGAFMEKFSQTELQHACIDIAVFGLMPAPNAPQIDAARSIVTVIQSSQPSFSSDIEANALDIQVFAGIAIGEYISKNKSIATAALIISALATRQLPTERYLAEFLSRLLASARHSTEEAASAERARPQLEIPPVQGVDLASLIKNIKIAMDALAINVNRNLQADREELEVLWYVFGGNSTTLDKPLQNLDISQRILATASELAQLVVMPPMKGSVQFLRAAVKEERRVTLRQLIEPCGSALFESVTRQTNRISDVLTKHPALLPITWLSRRRIESGLSSGWEDEFEQKTHITATEERTAFDWAAQVFNECVAARMLSLDRQDES